MRLHKIIWLIVLANCGTIQLTEPKINELPPAIVLPKFTKKIFLTIEHAEHVPGKNNMQVVAVTDAFLPELCKSEHPKTLPVPPTEKAELFKKIRDQNNELEFLEILKKESLKEPSRRYYTLWEVHQWSDNPAPFMYLMLHGLTIGLIPYVSSSEMRYDYLVVQNGQELLKERYPLEMSTLTWSPLILTGNIKFPRDLKAPKLSQNCMEITEKLLNRAIAE